MKFYMLDGNEKILCAVPSKDIISLYQNLNYHQADTIEGSLVLSEKYTSILNNVRYFAISDRESNHNFYLYRKTLVQVQNHEIAINGQGAFWDEMQGAYIKDKRPNQVTPADTIKLILSYSRWNVDYVDQMLEEESLRRDMNFYYVSLLDALNTVYQTWQVDIEPYINIEGHQITRRYVKLYQQQGGNNGRRFVYGDNALTVTQQANEGSIFTALVGRGAGVEETDASGNLTGGYSRKINFADIEWSKANGDPCDKPKGQEYVEWKESTELYGYSDGKPRIGIVNFDNEKDPAQLLKETWAQLQQVGVPLVQFQATVGDVGYLNLGETVTIVRYDLNIKYQTRVTGIKWNRCDEAKSQITIGVKAIQSTADKIAGLQQSVAQANVNADEAKSTANHAIIDGTGAVVNYGPNEPTNPKEGDIWYDVQPDGTVVLKQYQNGQWVILIDDTTGQQIKNKVEAQQKELDKAVQDANAASAKADGLVAQVGDANTNAQKALTTAQQNQADLAQAKSDLENTNSSLTGAISNISQAQEDLKNTQQSLQDVKSNLASNEEKLSDLTKQSQTQGQTIINIQKTQSGLSADIADVKGNVSSLQDTAEGLQATVADNSNDISSLKQTADSLQATISNIDVNNKNLFSVKKATVQNGIVTSDFIPIIPGKDYILTIYNKGNGTDTFGNYYEADKTTKGSVSELPGDGNTNMVNGSVVVHVPQNNALKYIQILIGLWDFNNISADQLQVSFTLGDSPVEYQPSVYDEVITTTQMKADLSGLTTLVNNNKGDISQLKQTSDSLTSQIGNANNDISSLKQTADGLQATVSNIDVNNKNLFSVKKATVQNGIVTSDFIPIIPGKDYILTIYNKGNGTDTFGNYYEADKTTKGSVSELPGDGNTNMVNGSVVVHVPQNNALKYIQILIGLWDFNNISADQLQVSFTLGDSPVEYQPSYFDEVTDTANMKLDIIGLTTDVANSKGDISSLKQRADSMESNISDNKNDISDLKQTASSLQNNIQSKTDISQFTQLSNEFQTVVQNIGAFLPDGDFSEVPQKYWIPWDITKDYSNLVWNGNDPNNLCMQINAHNGEFSKYITKDYIRINPNASVVYTGKSWFQRESGADGDFQAYIHYYDANKNEISYQQGWYRYDGDGWWNFNITQTPPNNAMYLRIESTVHSNHGNVDGLLTNLALQNGKGSISSKISQMSDDINLRVQKGDLLSQINIQAGSTLIQSKKLFLDASSVVFSGNAFIPSAAITDLSADKITAGTLNAGNVNIINLDVNKLVGNTTEFVRSGWTNAYGSHVQIDGGGMDVSYGNWYTRFDGNGMTFKDGGDNLGGFTRVGMTGAPDWYNGLAFNAGGDAEFLSIGAQDYGNDNQNPVPAKLLWMRSFDDKNRYGYQPGWNFCDTVWADDLKLNHIGTSSYRLDLVALSMNGETAFGLQSGNGYGFWWGANGGLGIYGGGKYVNFTHTKFINDIQMGQGGSINWSSL